LWGKRSSAATLLALQDDTGVLQNSIMAFGFKFAVTYTLPIGSGVSKGNTISDGHVVVVKNATVLTALV